MKMKIASLLLLTMLVISGCSRMNKSADESTPTTEETAPASTDEATSDGETSEDTENSDN